MRVKLDFIGCRLNISEMESLSRQFRVAGHQVVGPGETADLCVFNTCAVTNRASQSSRQTVRRLKRDNPKAKIIVTGCYAELDPDKIRQIGADLVVSNQDKEQLIQRACEAGLVDDVQTIPNPSDTFPLPAPTQGHSRAFIKVQDGCNNRCTFCIVTIARGAGRSHQIADVVQEIQNLHQAGYPEAILTGVHLGSFGHDWGNKRGLYELVKAILAETDIPRLRLSSLEPWDLDEDFFDLWQNPRLCRHLHLPLQSGNDEVLKRMARRTSQAEFAALVQQARQAIPGLGLTTDIIVGFPGESEAQFADSLAFVDQMAFSGIHIFRYSGRPGTAAYNMKGQIQTDIAKERSQQMHQIMAKHERQFRESLIGQSQSVLWETSETTPGGQLWSGLTDNYIRLSAFSGRNLNQQITSVTPTSLLPDGLAGDIFGEVIPLRVAVV